MSDSLSGKVAMVTGSAKGIGRASALELATCGADLVLNDWKHGEELEKVASIIKGMGRRALVCVGDIADVTGTTAMFSQTVNTFGRLDILVNNAAFSVRKPFLDLTPEEVHRTWNVSQWGVFYCSQLAARQMVKQGGGSIVMISSVHAFRPYPNASAYNAAKAAVNHLSASLALELVPHGIRVNAIEPGWIDTPGERQHNSEADIAEGKQRLPLGRLGTADEIARAVSYLCSDSASYITGATLRVDGGFSLKF